MIYPKTEIKYINDVIGYGVVATEFIPAGTITWVYDKLDREFTPDDLKKMDPIFQDILETYCFRNSSGNYILCWDHGRYVNHSFNSNCLSTAYDFEVAIRDINIGEQLTDDYGYLNISEPFTGIDEGTERKTVYPDDLLNYHNVWDKKILNVFSNINKLDQPLRSLVPKEVWDETIDVINGKKEMKSILSNYYNPNK